MAAPVRGHVREWLEPVGDAVVDLLLVRVRLCIALADALGDNAGEALCMTGVLAVLALHPGRVFEELAAERAAHNVVELLLDELVAVHLVDVLLSLADSALSSQAKVDWAAILVRLVKADRQVDPPAGLQVEPAIDRSGRDWRSATGRLLTPLLVARSARTRLVLLLLLLWRDHRELGRGNSSRSRSRAPLHPIGRYPARAVGLRLDPLSAHLFSDVGYSDPQQSDGEGMLARLIVNRKLELVGLVDLDVVIFRLPSVVARCSRPGDDVILDLDGNERLGAPCKPARGGVVDILNGEDPNHEVAGEGLAQVRRVDRVV